MSDSAREKSSSETYSMTDGVKSMPSNVPVNRMASAKKGSARPSSSSAPTSVRHARSNRARAKREGTSSPLFHSSSVCQANAKKSSQLYARRFPSASKTAAAEETVSFAAGGRRNPSSPSAQAAPLKKDSARPPSRTAPHCRRASRFSPGVFPSPTDSS